MKNSCQVIRFLPGHVRFLPGYARFLPGHVRFLPDPVRSHKFISQCLGKSYKVLVRNMQGTLKNQASSFKNLARKHA